MGLEVPEILIPGGAFDFDLIAAEDEPPPLLASFLALSAS